MYLEKYNLQIRIGKLKHCHGGGEKTHIHYIIKAHILILLQHSYYFFSPYTQKPARRQFQIFLKEYTNSNKTELYIKIHVTRGKKTIS